MKSNLTTSVRGAGLILSAASILALTGCVSSEDRPIVSHGYTAPTVAFTTQEVKPDTYTYYPQYSTFYGTDSHSFYSLDGTNWTAHATPSDVSQADLLMSPSVMVDYRGENALATSAKGN